MEQIADVRRILACDTQLCAHHLVMILRQRLRRLHAQPVQIEIFRVLSVFKQPLRLNRSLRARS